MATDTSFFDVYDLIRRFSACQSDFDRFDEYRLIGYPAQMMTPAQCRAARGLLQWSQDQLAAAAEVGVVTVRQFETEKAVPRRATLAAIERALDAAGVIFIAENGEGPGVRLKKEHGAQS